MPGCCVRWRPIGPFDFADLRPALENFSIVSHLKHLKRIAGSFARIY